MEGIKLSEINIACGGNSEKSIPDLIVSKIVTDSRLDCKNAFFVPLRGENFDGHDFIDEVIKKGAIGCLVEKNYRFTIPVKNFIVIRVNDTLKALGDIASFYRKKFINLPVLGITGSCGKTTSKEMVNSILQNKYKTVCSKENFNNEIGVPLTIFEISSDTQFGIIEMAMRGLGELKRLAEISLPNYGAVTNVELTHIGRLGSEANIAKAKKELLENLVGEKVAFLNGDNKWFSFLAENFEGKIITFGLQKKCNVWADEIQQVKDKGQNFNVYINNEMVNINLPIRGIFNIYNALLSIAVGWELGIDLQIIKDTLENFTSPQNRLSVFKLPTITLISDIYNSNPTSLKGALDVLRYEGNNKRKIVILGSMFELGDFAEKEHKEIGKMLTSDYADIVFTFGEEAMWFAEGMKEKTKMLENKCFSFGSEEIDAIKAKILSIIKKGDVILVKGSRGMKMERITNFIMEKYQ